MGIIRQKRKAETRALLLQAGLGVFAERGIEFATLDDIAQTAGFTKGAIYRQFPSKGAFLLALFEQYAAVARSGTGARQASWFIPLTLQFAAHAMRDPLLRRRFAVVLAEAPLTDSCSRRWGECCRRRYLPRPERRSRSRGFHGLSHLAGHTPHPILARAHHRVAHPEGRCPSGLRALCPRATRGARGRRRVVPADLRRAHH